MNDPTMMAEPMPAGMQAALAEVVGEEAGASADPKADEEARCHEALIRRFEQEAKFPQHEAELVKEIDELRKYVHTDVMKPKVPQGVAENLILRNQYIRMAQTYARDPDLTVEPVKLLPPDVPPELDQAMPGASEAMRGEFDAFVRQLEAFGKTIEILVKRHQDDGGLSRIVSGGIQDVQTDGLLWIKATWQENAGRDPIGTPRANDFQDTVKRLQTLVQQHEDGEFEEDDARYAEMKDVADSVRKQVMSERWVDTAFAGGDPREIAWESGERPSGTQIAELPRYRGFRFRAVNPADLRRDWSISRPEEYLDSRSMAHRVFMTDDEIRDTFGVTTEEIEASMGGTVRARGRVTSDEAAAGQANEEPQDPEDRGEPEREQLNGARAVWERWEKFSGRRYVWIQGARKFLVNEIPAVVTKRFYPFFLLYWNRATGRFMPISDAKLQKPLNDEYNLLRTHDRQGRRAAYNKYIVARNLLSPEEKTRLEQCPPEGVIECRKAREVQKYLQVVVGSNYKPELYDTSKVRMALDEAANIPSSARGNTAATKFATSDQIANQVMDQQSDRYRGAVEELLRDIAYYMADVLVQVLPESEAKAIAGPGAVWPQLDRESLWRYLQVTIQAGSTGKPDAQKKLQLLTQVADIHQKLGIGAPDSQWATNGLQVWRDLLDTLNIRTPAERYLIRRLPLLPTSSAAPVPVPGGAPPAGQAPAVPPTRPTPDAPPAPPAAAPAGMADRPVAPPPAPAG